MDKKIREAEVNISFFPEEKIRLKELSLKAGLPLSSFLRHKIFESIKEEVQLN